LQWNLRSRFGPLPGILIKYLKYILERVYRYYVGVEFRESAATILRRLPWQRVTIVPHGLRNGTASLLAEALQLTLALTPGNPGQQIAQREIAAALENALDARRQRIIISESQVNWVKWSCLFVQAVCALLAIALVHSGDRLASTMTMGLFASGVAACVLLIASHDRPFTGQISVGSELLLQVMPAASTRTVYGARRPPPAATFRGARPERDSSPGKLAARITTDLSALASRSTAALARSLSPHTCAAMKATKSPKMMPKTGSIPGEMALKERARSPTARTATTP
jgi:hypothetical protein